MMLAIGLAVIAQSAPASAAVMILEGGTAPQSSAPTPVPSAATPDVSGPAQPPADSGRLSPAPTASPSAVTPQAPPAPVATAPATTVPVAPAQPQPKPQSSALALNPAELPANPAELSLEMLPGQTVSIGTFVSFKVSSKKAGYLVLIDVDASGHLTQIYPNTASLTRTNSVNANYIKAGGTRTIPLAGDPYAGVRYVVSPPNGPAMVVGILSASPVQLLDLPDVPAEMIDRPSAVLAYLSQRTRELRIPDDGNQLKQAKWSFNAKPYVIQ
jgi:hypothetical protein